MWEAEKWKTGPQFKSPMATWNGTNVYLHDLVRFEGDIEYGKVMDFYMKGTEIYKTL